MPYKSEAQRRFFHAAEARGDISKKTVKEFDTASKGMDLPEKVKKHMSDGGFAQALKKHQMLQMRKKMWLGGEVETSDPDSDEVLRHNSSGDPHTNEKLSSESPMTYEAEESLSDYGMHDKLEDSEVKEPKQELDPEFVAKMFKGGMVPEANYPELDLKEEPNPYEKDKQDHEEGFGDQNYAHGGEVKMKLKPEHLFASYLKKKMKGY